jgi:hypothetical protein
MVNEHLRRSESDSVSWEDQILKVQILEQELGA